MQSRPEPGGGDHAAGEDAPDHLLEIAGELKASSAGMPNARFGIGTIDVDDFHTAPGNRRSLIPPFGEPVWELSEAMKRQCPYLASIGRWNDDWTVGFVRIPHFEFNARHVGIFGEIISRCEDSARALVVDISSNPGGSLFQMYALLSYLADRPIEIPRHSATLSPSDISDAHDIIARAKPGADEEDRPSPQMLEYARTILLEVAAGRQKRTNLLWLGGVKEVVPAAKHFSRKIVAVIDAVSFSAAEFMAAMLQDSRRATLFGTRTAGAGGCGRNILPLMSEDDRAEQASFGIAELTTRWTLGYRTDGRLIQDVGVTPDVSYKLTVDDLRYSGVGIRRALMQTLQDVSK